MYSTDIIQFAASTTLLAVLRSYIIDVRRIKSCPEEVKGGLHGCI